MGLKGKYSKIVQSRTAAIEESAWKNGWQPFFRDVQQGYFYRGFWKDDKKCGFGQKIFGKDKFCYDGNFENDLFHGFGRLEQFMPDKSTQVIYEGQWARGNMEGPGRWYIPENRKEKSCQPLRKLPEKILEPCVAHLECQMESEQSQENSCDFDFPERDSKSKYTHVHPTIGNKACGCVSDKDIFATTTDDFKTPTTQSSFNGICDFGSENLSQYESSLSTLNWSEISEKEIQEVYKGVVERSLEDKLVWLSKYLQSFHWRPDASDGTTSHTKNQTVCRVDPTKPSLNNTITFQQLKQVYNEFQNRARQERIETNEFVNDPRFQVKPDPNQESIEYVPPQFTDTRKSCPKDIFCQNVRGNKISIRQGETMDLMKAPKPLNPQRRLNFKVIDEAKLKFYVYDGMMVDGLPHGVGLSRYPDDVVYYGDWRRGKFHGRGLLMSLNEFSWEGEFKNGIRLGQGVYINYKTGYVQRGLWAGGSFVESTVEIHPVRRQSAVYPAIYPLPVLQICDNSDDVSIQKDCKACPGLPHSLLLIRCEQLLKCVV